MKKLATLFAFLILFFKGADIVNASDFFVDANLNYHVTSDGKTTADFVFSIENATSEKFAKMYYLNLYNFEPVNLKISENGQELKFSEERVEGNSIVEIQFDDAVAGIGKKREFLVTFESFTLAEKIGDTWEISLPKLDPDSQFREYRTAIEISKQLGEEAFVSPNPIEKIVGESSTIFVFDKSKISNQSINLAFGNFQVFSFKIDYHLENTSEHGSEVKLAIPPDTAYQTVYYTIIDPKPLNIQKDADSNWIATYVLDPGERMDVVTQGFVKIYSFPRRNIINLNPTDKISNTNPTKYWQSDDPQIQELARKLKTPEAIYNYVVSTLTYNYDRVQPDAIRFGAKGALQSPDQALCMEFTDLFIALSRAAGIPAREINGYAYSNNIKIQPLSLVADVLHSWPEYWDSTRKVWVPVDPTWGSTTGGKDYFNRFDLSHFTFVIHGTDDTIPFPPGSYKSGLNPEKDIFVDLSELPVLEESKPEVISSIDFKNVWTTADVNFSIENNNPFALYNETAYIFFDEELIHQQEITDILPHGKKEFSTEINYGFLALNAPEQVKIVMGDHEFVFDTNKRNVLIYHLLSLLIFIGIGLVIVIIKIKPDHKISFRKLIIKPNFKLNDKINSLRRRNEPIFQHEEQISQDQFPQE